MEVLLQHERLVAPGQAVGGASVADRALVLVPVPDLEHHVRAVAPAEHERVGDQQSGDVGDVVAGQTRLGGRRELDRRAADRDPDRKNLDRRLPHVHAGFVDDEPGRSERIELLRVGRRRGHAAVEADGVVVEPAGQRALAQRFRLPPETFDVLGALHPHSWSGG